MLTTSKMWYILLTDFFKTKKKPEKRMHNIVYIHIDMHTYDIYACILVL